jgi:hypothetical protein
MNIRGPRIPMSESVNYALADIGAEPLAGSGFEEETPETELWVTIMMLRCPRLLRELERVEELLR